MARFRGTIQGQRGMASRLGSKSSGLHAKINGWNIGVSVYALVNEAGEDQVSVEITGGSNGYGMLKDLGTFTRASLDKKQRRAS